MVGHRGSLATCWRRRALRRPTRKNGTLSRSVPFLHGRELPDEESRWWGGCVEEHMREKEPALPPRRLDLSDLRSACAPPKRVAKDPAVLRPVKQARISPTSSQTLPLAPSVQKSSIASLYVKCPNICKREIASKDIKLTGAKAQWDCQKFRKQNGSGLVGRI